MSKLICVGFFALIAAAPAMAQDSSPDQGKNIRDSVGRQLSSLTSEIVDANRAAEKELNLRARVEVQPNEIIEFYEPYPGQITVSRAGAPDGPLEPLSGGPQEIWRRVARGFEMPAGLREALARQAQTKPPPQESESKEQPPIKQEWGGGSSESLDGRPVPMTKKPDGAQYRSFRSGGWCDRDFLNTDLGRCPSNAYDFKVCMSDWWDGAFAYHHDAFISYGVVCPANGSVAFRIRSNEFGGGFWTVPQDTFRSWSGTDNGCQFGWDDCPYVRADVEQAIGRRFHFRFGVVAE